MSGAFAEWNVKSGKNISLSLIYYVRSEGLY